MKYLQTKNAFIVNVKTKPIYSAVSPLWGYNSLFVVCKSMGFWGIAIDTVTMINHTVASFVPWYQWYTGKIEVSDLFLWKGHSGILCRKLRCALKILRQIWMLLVEFLCKWSNFSLSLPNELGFGESQEVKMAYWDETNMHINYLSSS